MKKQIISVILCFSMLLSIFAISLTVNATTINKNETKASITNQTTGVSKITSASDFTWDNANVYFLLTDRFKNGNTSNDHSYGRATDKNGTPLSGWDTAPGTFHGGDFAGITQEIEAGYFDDLGVNAIWISAPYEQIHGYVDSGKGFAHYSYHGYYVLDYTETDANFGTKEEFQTLVDTAHEHGIRIVMDIVMNHSGYNTVADMEEYGFGTLLDGASEYKYKLDNISDVNNHIDFSTSASDWGNWWGNDWIRSGLPGYTDGNGGSDLTRCLEGLPDFRTEDSKSVTIPPLLKTKWTKEGTYNQKIAKYGTSGSVSDYLTKWLSEWVSEYGVDGFRCDTAKHVEKASWKKLKDTCVSALKTWRQNNPTKAGADWDEDFWMTGECWDHNIGYGYDSYYTEGGFDSMINFDSSGSPLPSANSINGKYQNYADSINSNDNFNQLTYISSHDSNLARSSDMAYQGSALMLLPGAVQIFYGDETNRKTVSGMSFDGHGGSGHSLRSDMNWDSIDTDELAHWQKVGKFRSNHVAVGAGQHQQITAYNDTTGYTFARTYDDGNVSDNIIATIGAPNNKDIAVEVSSLWSDGTVVTNAYDGTKATVTDGKATFNSGAHGTILIEGPVSTINMSIKGDYSFYDSQEVTVSLKGADYAMVSVNGGEEFRVVNGDKFTIGEDIPVGTEFKVKMTASNEEETASKSFTFKKKDPNAVTRIYLDNTALKWGSSIYAYIYDESGSTTVENAKWPGQTMAYDSSTGLYVMEVPDNLTDGQVIFTDGSNRYPADMQPGLQINSTDMIFSSGNSWTAYTGEKPTGTVTTPTTPANSVTVYYENTNNWSTPYVYYWKSSSNSGSVSWPGVAMTKYKDNVWMASFPAENDMCIFSNNGGNQTGDLSIPGNGYLYSGSSWSSSAYVVPTTTTKPTTVSTTTKPTPALIIGDANNDGLVDVKDATLIQKYTSLLDVEIDLTVADVNNDSIVNIKDATMIQKYACGKIDKLG